MSIHSVLNTNIHAAYAVYLNGFLSIYDIEQLSDFFVRRLPLLLVIFPGWNVRRRCSRSVLQDEYDKLCLSI